MFGAKGHEDHAEEQIRISGFEEHVADLVGESGVGGGATQLATVTKVTRWPA